MNDASVLFSEAGLALPFPEQELLFLEDFVYTAGLQEEYSISANYARDPVRKDRGFAACNWLALNRDVPEGSRDLARSNLRFYYQPAKAMMPSFAARPVGFTPPDGYRLVNASVTRWGDQIVLAQGVANGTPIDDGPSSRTPDDAPAHTRNFLLRLADDLALQTQTEILPPSDMPAPAYPLTRGFEGMRLFVWRDELWSISCVRELTPEGWCEQVLARVHERGASPCRLTDWRVLHPEGPRRHEMNWMPLLETASAETPDDRLLFISMCDPNQSAAPS
jgi:hypothetical protein